MIQDIIWKIQLLLTFLNMWGFYFFDSFMWDYFAMLVLNTSQLTVYDIGTTKIFEFSKFLFWFFCETHFFWGTFKECYRWRFWLLVLLLIKQKNWNKQNFRELEKINLRKDPMNELNVTFLTWFGIIIWLICLGPNLFNDLYTVIWVTNDMMTVAIDDTVKRCEVHPFNMGVKRSKSSKL